MSRPRAHRLSVRTLVGVLAGMLCGFVLTTWWKQAIAPCVVMTTNYYEDLVDMVQVNIPPPSALPDPVIKEPPPGAKAKNLIFIGVMTAQIYLDTRARAVHETWRNEIPGDVQFFSKFGSVSKFNLPVVPLVGVDDSYPPQKKSFMMLKYMHDHFIDQYEWFMRADDDVYIKGDKLAKFLRSLNSSKPQFIGQAGLGTKDEFGQLSLDLDENFCMGGPGIVFSRETLKKLVPHISYCLKNLYSTHEDVEVGRCVRQAAGIPCTWAFEMQHLFYHNYRKNNSYIPMLKSKEVQRAITLHPIKTPSDLYKVHQSVQERKSMDLRHKALLYEREIAKFQKLIQPEGNYVDRSRHGQKGLQPSLMKFVPRSRSQVLPWEYISKNNVYTHTQKNPKVGYDAMTKTSLEDMVVQVMQMINKNARQKGRTIDFKEILYGYRRVNPLYGVDYILDILLTYRKHKGRKMTIPVRRHAYLQQAFADLEFMEEELLPDTHSSVELTNQRPSAFLQIFHSLNYFSAKSAHRTKRGIAKSSPPTMVNMILPLAGRYETFQRFLKNFEDVCLLEDTSVSLTVILYPSETSDFQSTLNLLNDLGRKYPRRVIDVVQTEGHFSRASALQIGAKQHGANSLLFFIDVDIFFNHEAIDRVRFNTRQYHALYFPIVFSHYNPQYGCAINNSCPPTPFVFNADLGYWRQFGFGIAAMYKSDMEIIGGYDTNIKGWGKEDVQFYTNVVHSNLTLFRAVDPGMVHVFHPIICDSNLDPSQYDMCLGSMASSLASVHRLAEMAYKSPAILEHKSVNDSQDAKRRKR